MATIRMSNTIEKPPANHGRYQSPHDQLMTGGLSLLGVEWPPGAARALAPELQGLARRLAAVAELGVKDRAVVLEAMGVVERALDRGDLEPGERRAYAALLRSCGKILRGEV